jgi:hypothetical protein
MRLITPITLLVLALVQRSLLKTNRRETGRFQSTRRSYGLQRVAKASRERCLTRFPSVRNVRPHACSLS